MEKNETNKDGEDDGNHSNCDNHSKLPKGRPQLTAFAPGAAEVTIEGIVGSPTTTTPTDDASARRLLSAYICKKRSAGVVSSCDCSTLQTVFSISVFHIQRTMVVRTPPSSRLRRGKLDCVKPAV